jgi:hypothetical protein
MLFLADDVSELFEGAIDFSGRVHLFDEVTELVRLALRGLNNIARFF